MGPEEGFEQGHPVTQMNLHPGGDKENPVGGGQLSTPHDAPGGVVRGAVCLKVDPWCSSGIRDLGPGQECEGHRVPSMGSSAGDREGYHGSWRPPQCQISIPVTWLASEETPKLLLEGREEGRKQRRVKRPQEQVAACSQEGGGCVGTSGPSSVLRLPGLLFLMVTVPGVQGPPGGRRVQLC